MNILLNFIKEKFTAMPKWVQVLTYLSFLLILILIIVNPKFIDVRLVSNDYGEEFPIGGALIEVETSGRVISILTNDKGRFSVPISFRNPLSNYSFVMYPDIRSNKQIEIEVPVSNSYIKRSKIVYTKKDKKYKVMPCGVVEKVKDYFAYIFPVKKAYAQSINNLEDVKWELLDAIETVTGTSKNDISLDDSLSDLEIDNVDLSYIRSRLEKRFGTNNAWRQILFSARTVRDILNIARLE